MNPKLEVYERIKKVVDTLPFTNYGFWVLEDSKHEAFLKSIIDACGLVLLRQSLDKERALLPIFQKKVPAEQVYMDQIAKAIAIPYEEIERSILNKTFTTLLKMPYGSILQNPVEKENFVRALVDAMFRHDVIFAAHFEDALWKAIMCSQGKQSAQDRARYVAAVLQRLIVAQDEKDVYMK